MAPPVTPQRVTFSPGEFAALFGKSQTWGYRQIYAGKVKTITEFGRILIPAAEVEKILATAERYEGKKPKAPKTKAEFQKLGPELQNGWRSFVQKRRAAKASPVEPAGEKARVVAKRQGNADLRRAALDRLGRKR